MQATSKRRPPVWLTASEVQELTIWDNKEKMRKARNNGNLLMIRKDGKILYNANGIDKIFFKKQSF